MQQALVQIDSTELTTEMIEPTGNHCQQSEGDQVPEAGGNGCGHIIGVDSETV